METSAQPIRIAIAGHTNAGKTTFIRTMMRQIVGEVEDRANVTEYPEDYVDRSLGSIFVDTPGFQNAGEFLIRADMERNGDPALNQERFKRRAEAVRYDRRAFDAASKCDILLYVAPITEPPDDAHAAELELARDTGCAVIGLINQYAAEVKSHGKEATSRKIKLWQDLFTASRVETTILFDSYWSQPSTLLNLYDAILAALPDKRKPVFANGLRIVRSELAVRQAALCDLVAQCVINCGALKETCDSVHHAYSVEKAKEAASIALRNGVGYEVQQLVTRAKETYGIDVNQPSLHDAALAMLTNETQDSREKHANMTAYGTRGAWILGVVGAIVGTLIFPGPGTATGAAIGTALGGSLGAGVGSDEPTNTHIIAQLTDADLRFVFQLCVAISWALSFQGFGRGNRVNQSIVTELRDRVADLAPVYANVTRQNSRQDLGQTMATLMERLDSMPPAQI